MDAERLATLILEDGESAKDFLKRHNIKGRLPGPDEVEYELYREEEDREPDFEDPRDNKWIRDQLSRGNEWAWFSAHVVAEWTAPDGEKFQGDDYLGGCSYRSKKDFMAKGGYYDDMKSEAYDDLIRTIQHARRTRQG